MIRFTTLVVKASKGFVNFQYRKDEVERVFFYHIRRLATAATAAIAKRRCSFCKERLGVLHCENDKWICDTCAQVTNDLAPH